MYKKNIKIYENVLKNRLLNEFISISFEII